AEDAGRQRVPEVLGEEHRRRLHAGPEIERRDQKVDRRGQPDQVVRADPQIRELLVEGEPAEGARILLEENLEYAARPLALLLQEGLEVFGDEPARDDLRDVD